MKGSSRGMYSELLVASGLHCKRERRETPRDGWVAAAKKQHPNFERLPQTTGACEKCNAAGQHTAHRAPHTAICSLAASNTPKLPWSAQSSFSGSQRLGRGLLYAKRSKSSVDYDQRGATHGYDMKVRDERIWCQGGSQWEGDMGNRNVTSGKGEGCARITDQGPRRPLP
jgi:hypothetical protein